MAEAKPKDEKEEAAQVAVPANERHSPARVVDKRSLAERLTTQAETLSVDGDQTYERIIQQVLNADSVDIVLTPQELRKADDLVGQAIVIVDFDLQESEFDAGSPFYATMHVITSESEEPEPINCGHRKLLAQLVRIKELSGFPVACQVVRKGKARIGGTDLLELTKWTDEQQRLYGQTATMPF
jgi:hypothetical protein